MDSRRFDSLTRSLAGAKSRRGFLGSLAALGAAVLAARDAGAQVTQARCGNKVCASNPAICTGGCVCCAYSNGNSRCRPPQDCTAPGTVLSPSTTTAVPATTTTTTAAPSCEFANPQVISGPPSQATFTVRESTSGLSEILVIRSENADTVIPPFILGTTDPVVVTSTKIDQIQASRIEFRTTSLGGTVRICEFTF